MRINRHHRSSFYVCLFLVVSTCAVYWQVWNHDATYFDDGQYVFENPHIKAGLTSKGTVWAWTAFYAGNWHPATWLSHMMDVEFFGLNPGPHHLTNLIFHIANTLLLFLILHRMTDTLWSSGFVAALFALHPLHVESVAWIAERKDVLSTFFWMMTMGAYIRYVEKPRIFRYVWVLVFFTLGLMAKPMVVTLPFVLLLLDYWPLGRLASINRFKERQLNSVIYEKIPFLILSALSSLMTYMSQQGSGAIRSLDAYPIGLRLANALVAYATYLLKMFWPSDLAVMYPHATHLPTWQTASAFCLLTVISIFAILKSKKYPFLIFGWLWYLGTLLPVIGLVQVGSQAMADRYTYIPLIGPFIMAAWGGMTLIQRWRIPQAVSAAAGIVILLLLSMVARVQVGYWFDSISLFSHTLAVTKNNYVIHNNMGLALADQGRFDDAIQHYRKVLEVKPRYKKALNNIGAAFLRQGRYDEAVIHFRKALEIDVKYARAHSNLGNALVAQGFLQKGIDHYRQALKFEPDDPATHNNLGIALTRQRNFKEAAYHYFRAMQMNPHDARIYNNLGVALYDSGNVRESIRHFKTALTLNPQYADAARNMRAAKTTLEMADPINKH